MASPTGPVITQRLPGRSVLVTGAGTGFGAEIAVRAAQEGARVGVHYRSSKAGAEQTLARIEQLGGQATLVQGDITSWDDIRRMAGGCVQGLRRARCAHQQRRRCRARADVVA